MSRYLRILAATTIATAPMLSACGSSDGGSDSGTAVAISASDDACQLDSTELPAGETTFAVTNDGSKVTEVYVYGEESGAFTKVVTEVENIGPGTSRDMSVTLDAGSYEIACKPGMVGDGIRTPITVTGDSGSSPDEGDEAKYDREIELSTDGTSLTGAPDDAGLDEKIEFKLENTADVARTLELKDPSGEVAGEVEVAPGETGEIIVELASAGTWQIILEGDGIDDITSDLSVS